MLTTFPCTSCGACCRSLSGSDVYRKLDRGDGTCRYYDDQTRLCSIYTNRPSECKIDHTYEMSLSDRISKDDYYDLNIKACNELQEQLLIPESFRISSVLNERDNDN